MSDVLTIEALRRAKDILMRLPEPSIIVLGPRLWRYAKRLGYLKNSAYIFVRAKKVGR